MRIRNNIFIAFALIIIIPIIILGCFFYFKTQEQIETDKLNYINTIADVRVETIESFVDTLKHDLNILQHAYTIKTSMPLLLQSANNKSNPSYIKAKEILSSVVLNAYTGRIFLEDMILFDPEGTVIYSINEKRPNLEFGKKHHLWSKSNLIEWRKGIWVSRVHKESDTTYTIMLVAPIFDSERNVIGFVAFEINNKILHKLCESKKGLMGVTGEILLGIKEDNDAIYLSPLQYSTETQAKDRIPLSGKKVSPISIAVRGINGSGKTVDYRGVKVLSAWRYIPSLDIGLVVKIDETEALTPIYQFRNIVIATTIILLLLSLFIANLIAKRIANPLVLLLKGIKTIGKGNFNYKVEATSTNEAGQLARAFNEMVDSLTKITTSITNLETEVTKHKEAEEKLTQITEYTELLFKSVPSAIFTVDKNKRITNWNKKAEDITGYSFNEVIGKECYIFASTPCDERCGLYTENVIKPVVGKECTLRRKGGQIRFISKNADFLRDRNGNITGGIECFEDITERKKLEEALKKSHMELEEKNLQLFKHANELKYLAAFDILTDLPNRRCFENTLQEVASMSKRHEQKFALIIADIDNFKWINDTLGHDMGDATLKQIALLLKKNLRKEDFVARIGGDEFAIILKGLGNYESVVFVANKILKELQFPIHIKSIDVQTSVSIGVTFYPLSSDNIEILFKQADIAMYKAKSKGKNCIEFFSEEIKKSYSRTNEIEYALQFAIEKKELSLLYQPIVNMTTNKIVGLEALLRWQNDKLGDVNPLEFIPIAENKGFINKIGLWSFNEACNQGKVWKQQGIKDLFLTINISPVQLKQEDFTKQIANIIESYQIKRIALEIELTESILKKELNFIAKDFLIFIKQIQFKLSLDDFGTGYSPLTSLTEIPLNTLKINGDFLKNIQDGSKNYNILNNTITLAKTLSLETIAECVETKEQADILLKLGCELAQGFYYYNPMSIEEITTILLTHIK